MSEREDVFPKFDCHYDGDINRCDKDCKQLGECKRRTTGVQSSSDKRERALWLADKLVGDYGSEAAQLLRYFASVAPSAGVAPAAVDAAIERMLGYPDGSYMRCPFCGGKSGGMHKDDCAIVIVAAALRTPPSEKGRSGMPLLYNVFCMGAQERDAEWEYQWRQLMQAVELELTAAGYTLPAKGADQHG